MRGIALLALMGVVPTQLIAQPDADLNAMVETEKAFIQMARAENRRDAFLFFLSDSVVTQGPNGPIKGKARLQQQPVTEDWLDWEVGYSDIAASGDFGFNSGPWNYRPKKTDEKPIAFGAFNSVWKKQPDGSWKNILDIGISHGPPAAGEKVIWATSSRPLRKRQNSGTDVFQAEKEFQDAISVHKIDAYRKFLSSEARMMVSGYLPFTGSQGLNEYHAACPSTSGTKVMAGETARSNDMGYVYGTTTVVFTKNGTEESKTTTFVRIWKREDSMWKIVLDVLSF